MSLADSVLHAVAITRVDGVGAVLARNLVTYLGSSEAVFSSDAGRLAKVPGIGSVIRSRLKATDAVAEASRILEKCEKLGIEAIPITARDYPSKLKESPDAPFVLYVKGSLPTALQKSIGVVGTRNCTAYGRHVATQIVTDLSGHSPSIISGLALGIDTIAHKAALQADLHTVAVFATGLDRIYPAGNKELAARILEKGCLISEYPPESKMDPTFFPARNRIIAGMSDAIVVVETAEKGGSLITARMGLDYNKEVFAVPGPITERMSKGCNQLIAKSEAAPYLDAHQFAQAMGWEEKQDSLKGPNAKNPITNTSALPATLSETEVRVVSALRELDNQHIDDLGWKLQIPVNILASTLLSLEFQGLVRSLPGKKFTARVFGGAG